MAGLLDGVAYDTRLDPAAEAEYRAWATAKNRLRDTEDYDLRGAWREGYRGDPGQHGTDKFKKPNHPTFSDESIYASAERPGGHWSGDDNAGFTYEAARDFQRYRTPDDLLNYFQAREPGVRVVLPKGTR